MHSPTLKTIIATVLFATVATTALGTTTVDVINNAQSDLESFRIRVPFPKTLKLKNLRDWDSFESKVLFNTTCRLIRFDFDKPEPSLAESWTISDDRLRIEFRLRKDAKYSDGTPIVADDVLMNFNRHLRLDGQFAEVYKSAGIEMKTIGQHVFVMLFKKEVPTVFEHLASLSFSIIPPSRAKSNVDEVDAAGPSSGSYKVTSFGSSKLVLEINKNHWGSSTKNLLQRVEISPATKGDLEHMRSGEIDGGVLAGASQSKDELERIGVQFIKRGPTLVYFSIDFNGPSLSKYPEIAKLIHTYLDRKAIVESLKVEFPGYAPAHGVSAMIEKIDHEESIRFSNEERISAKTKLVTIARSMKNDNVEFTLSYTDASNSSKSVVEAVTTELRKIGFPVRHLILPFSEILEEPRTGRFDGGLVSHGLDGSAPAVALQFLAGTSPTASNLPPSHEVFRMYPKLSNVRGYAEHLELLREYNTLNSKTGFIIPIVTSMSYHIFGSRFDVSRVRPYQGRWEFFDIRLISNGLNRRKR